MTLPQVDEGTMLRALAPAKVNLCLFLGAAREDGKHELVTLLESISLADELTVRVLPRGRHDEVSCPGVEGANLVSAALQALRGSGWEGPPVRVEVVKRVPVAAGLAGGSADAAATLRLATALVPMPGDVAAGLAARLGADVPSQLAPGVVLGTGAGDSVRRVGALAPHAFLLLPQQATLSTGEVYREADRLGLPRDDRDLAARLAGLEEALAPGARLPSELLVNDLQQAARSLCPACDDALRAALAAGAEAAFVCGSGPTVAGVFWGFDGETRAAAAADALEDRFPGAVPVMPVEGAFGAAVRG